MKIHLLVQTTESTHKVLFATLDPVKAIAHREAMHRAHWAYHDPQWRATGFVRTWEQHWAMAQAEDWSPRIEVIEVQDSDTGLLLDALANARIEQTVATMLEVPTSRYNSHPDAAEEEARALAAQVMRTVRSGVAEALAGSAA